MNGCRSGVMTTAEIATLAKRQKQTLAHICVNSIDFFNREKLRRDKAVIETPHQCVEELKLLVGGNLNPCPVCKMVIKNIEDF